MPELIIKYNDTRTLRILSDLAKYFDYQIEMPAKSVKPVTSKVNIALIKGDKGIDIKGLERIFTGKNLNPQNIRSKAWSLYIS